MMSPGGNSIMRIACLLFGLFALSGAMASDVEDLTEMLRDFLGSAHVKAAHQTFWAEDLIYTSSNGTRFGKSEILAGFEAADSSDETPAVVYSAADIDVRVFDSIAVVAFRLVGTPSDGSEILEYFNTGTFLRRSGSWQAVAWQATSISKDTRVND